MNIIYVKFKLKWQFKKYPEYKITPCKKVINTKTNKLLTYNERGFFIKDRYLKKQEINKHIELIPKKQYLPF